MANPYLASYMHLATSYYIGVLRPYTETVSDDS